MIKTTIYKYLAKIYGFVTNLRNKLYDCNILKSYSVSLPVICVGNLTAGGNSKTPLCIYLARLLSSKGKKPIILTRGYKGSIQGPHLVHQDDTVSMVGDEALLMHCWYGLSVIVSKDRVKGAKFIEDNKLADLIILDDGFQHRRLKRDLNIVCVNASNTEDVKEFAEGELLPLGRFREERSAGLQRANLLIFINRSSEIAVNSELNSLAGPIPEHISVFNASFAEFSLTNLVRKEDSVDLTQSVVAFCSIANPQGFFTVIKNLGYNIKACKAYPDHYQYTWDDIKNLQSTYPDSRLICTTKDAVKLDPQWGAPISVLKAELEFRHSDAFASRILKAVV